MSISISPCGDDKDIGFVGSLGSGDDELLLFLSLQKRRNLRNPFAIMQGNPITMFREYVLEYLNHIESFIRGREDTVITLGFERQPMRLEPFMTFPRRKLPESLADKVTSTSILGEENFLILDASCQITSSSSSECHFCSRDRILVENIDMIFARIGSFNNRRCGHESSSSGSDDRDSWHRFFAY